MIGRLHGIVIDTPDPDAAAASYAELLGRQRMQDEPDGHPFCLIRIGAAG